LEQTLEKMKAKLGPDHPATLQSMNNLAEAYRATRPSARKRASTKVWLLLPCQPYQDRGSQGKER